MAPGGYWWDFVCFSMDFWDLAGPLGSVGPPVPLVPLAFLFTVICWGFKVPPPPPPPKPPYQPLSVSMDIHGHLLTCIHVPFPKLVRVDILPMTQAQAYGIQINP